MTAETLQPQRRGKSISARRNTIRELAIASGTWRPYEDATVVAEHITRLRTEGMSSDSIAAAAGVDRTTVENISRRERVLASTARAILAITSPIDSTPDTRLVPAIGTVRRIRALQAIGWPTRIIGAHLGMTVGHISYLCREQDAVTAARARQVRDVYRRLARTPGPSKITARRAAEAGWASPAVWADIDDPDEVPTGMLVRPQGRTVRAMTDLADRLRAGVPVAEIAAGAGVTVRALDERAFRYWKRTGDREPLDLLRAAVKAGSAAGPAPAPGGAGDPGAGAEPGAAVEAGAGGLGPVLSGPSGAVAAGVVLPVGVDFEGAVPVADERLGCGHDAPPRIEPGGLKFARERTERTAQ